MLRRVLRNWEGTPEERQRLDLERQLATNHIVTGGRVLIPTRGGLPSLVAAQIGGLTWPDDTEFTLLTVTTTTDRNVDVDLTAYRNVLHDRSVNHLEVAQDDIAQAILDEARLGYNALIMGAGIDKRPTADSNGGAARTVVSRLVDDVLSHSPIPVVVVRPPRNSAGRLPWAFTRALVPVNGSRTAQGAQEIAAYRPDRRLHPRQRRHERGGGTRSRTRHPAHCVRAGGRFRVRCRRCCLRWAGRRVDIRRC